MATAVYVRATGIYDDSRATKEIQALAETVEKVVVLAWDRSGDSQEKCGAVFQNHSNVSLRFFPRHINGSIGVKNIGLLLSWFRWIAAELSTIDRVDLIHACNLDTALGVMRFAKKHRCRLVYDIYDYYVDSHSLPRFSRGLVEHLEIRIINRADVTVICTEERRAQIAGASPKKLLIIHNSPDVERLQETEDLFDYVYCGTMNGGRLIQEILDHYPQNSDLRFLFAGYGRHAEKAKLLSEEYEHFHFAGTIPYSEVLKLENQSLVISALYNPSSRNHQLCAPNKFYEALALGKPLIVCEGTGIDKLVAQHKLGRVISYDAERFYAALRALISDRKQLQMTGRSAREIYEQEYHWRIMKDRLTVCYQELLNHPDRR